MSTKTVEVTATVDTLGNVTVKQNDPSFWDKKFMGIGSLRNGDVAEIAVICTGAAVVGYGVAVLLDKIFGPSQISAGLTDSLDSLL
ncbi:MAG TPA: hypothetical protein VN081_05085 [Dongiaceae bacterium]|nr:hypothetical protein [Dongiaceae bacterium]